VSASDLDGTVPTLSTSPLPAGASFTDNLNGTGTFNWTPGFNQGGSYFITFRATDGVVTDSEFVTISVNEAGNQAPILATIGPRSVTEGLNLNFGVSATDPDGTTPALSTSSLPAGASFVNNGNGTGTFNWTPTFTQSGSYFVFFYATDAGAQRDSEIVSVTVIEAGNQAPVLAAIGNRSTSEGTLLTFGVSATDADGTLPTLTTSALPTGAAFTNNGNGTGTFNWTPTFTQAGLYNLTFRATDGAATDSEVISITVNEAGNQAPVLAAIGNRGVTEGGLLNFTVTAADPDGSTPALNVVGLPVLATFTDHGNGTGTFNWTPGFTQSGNYNVRFRASDGSAVDSEIISITVSEAGNQSPELAAIGPKSVSEGGLLNFNVSSVDPDSTTPSLSTSALPAGATFTDLGNRTGTFNWSPSFTQAGNYNITFRASDGVLKDTEIVTVTVVEAGNQVPVLAAIGSKSVAENALLSFSISATDPDGSLPSFSMTPIPSGATLTNNGNGTATFNWTPSFTQSGPYNVRFIASDGLAADSELVTITVNEAGNQPPVLATIGPRSVTEGANLNFAISAVDPDGTTPTFTSTALPAGATLTNNGNGTATFNWTPAFNQSGSYPRVFRATDGSLVDTEIVTITVNEAGNQAPVLAAIGPRSTNENVLLTFVISATDADGTVPALTTSSLPSGATFTNHGNGTGTFNWTPDFAQSGSYNVTFRASDGFQVDTEVVPITVNEIGNQAPVLAAIGPRTVTEGANLNFNLTATDPDGTLPTFTSTALPAGATLTNNGNGSATFNWTPGFNQAGSYPRVFRATDGALVDTEIVTITVNEAGNQAPVLAAIGAKSATEGVLLTVPISATDPDGTIPALTTGTLPSGAALVDNGNGTGTFNWTPSFTQAGVQNVVFRATDAATARDTESQWPMRATRRPSWPPSVRRASRRAPPSTSTSAPPTPTAPRQVSPRRRYPPAPPLPTTATARARSAGRPPSRRAAPTA